MSAPIIDLSGSFVWHFFITVFESPTICKLLKPMEMANCITYNPACASVANGVGISEWITVLDTKISPLSSPTARPKADLEDIFSKAA
ncbi:hypothetical protein V6Z11_A05G309300 [Gossypium hirsutum]